MSDRVIEPHKVAGRGVLAYGGGRAGRAVVGCGLLGRGSGVAGGRLDGSCPAAAGLLQRGGRYDQRARGGGRNRPVGDDGRAGGRGRLPCHDGAGAEAGRPSRAAHPDDRRCRHRPGRGKPSAGRGRRLAAPYGLGGHRLYRPDGLAGGCPAAGARGAGRLLRPSPLGCCLACWCGSARS